YNLSETVMRIASIAYGDGKTNTIRITCTEDVFDLPSTAFVQSAPPAWEDPNAPPATMEKQISFECPYYKLVKDKGPTVID
ncbi:hypothetical protein, partial [Streptococcus pneumoniae]|uniref:hypothetical protein n=1 Tax=Streptococcus pneumoniae TaxID=1313 RepID=UPI001E5631BE